MNDYSSQGMHKINMSGVCLLGTELVQNVFHFSLPGSLCYLYILIHSQTVNRIQFLLYCTNTTRAH